MCDVMHVPGHTLGQVNVLLSDNDGEKYFFTGDNIFVESIGRPDLGGRGTACPSNRSTVA